VCGVLEERKRAACIWPTGGSPASTGEIANQQRRDGARGTEQGLNLPPGCLPGACPCNQKKPAREESAALRATIIYNYTVEQGVRRKGHVLHGVEDGRLFSCNSAQS
jgi:hypothetical protein